MSDAKAIMEMIKENDITYVDLRFTDPRGKMQHVTQHIDTIDEESLAEGFMFDGSSIAGWKAINESDMTLMPDLYRCYVDPFFAQPTLAVFCDVLEPSTGSRILHLRRCEDRRVDEPRDVFRRFRRRPVQQRPRL